ncbi:phage holin family protein [Phycicoccus sp. BSK3Z-2]|uniref:Phage holin family protein n=1 Tax=Phycicoccus avicenniae TaxID=2828860 RepID=A0A941HZ68_9MICO|nr:phage holin family protein [Phycicoccus avicenniae]MBR7743753.1 phage holin family protein [Phycicoccus avicenniae]
MSRTTGPGDPASPPGTHRSQEPASTGQLLSRMSSDLSDLVRSEIALAKTEIQESVKHAGRGAGLFGTGGVVALYGVGALVAAAILALSLVLDAWLAALIVAVVLFVAAGVAALVGKREVARSTPPVQHSVESVKADVDAVRHHGHHGTEHAPTGQEGRR